MTIQLNKAQIDAIKVELAKFGLSVTVARKAKSGLSAIRAWKPQTPAGAKCKSRMLMYANLPPIRGAYNAITGLTGLSCGRSVTGSEIDMFYRSLGAIRPMPDRKLLTYQA